MAHTYPRVLRRFTNRSRRPINAAFGGNFCGGYGFWPPMLRIEMTVLHEKQLRECRPPQFFKEDQRSYEANFC